MAFDDDLGYIGLVFIGKEHVQIDRREYHQCGDEQGQLIGVQPHQCQNDEGDHRHGFHSGYQRVEQFPHGAGTGGHCRQYHAQCAGEQETAEDVGDARYVGIRMHSITPGPGENTLSCRVTEVVENPFSQTLMLERSDCPGKVPIGWETEKSTAPLPAVLDVSFPKNGS